MNITVIGSGTVGRSVSVGLASHGHEVSLSSRSPEGLADWSARTGIAVLPSEDSLAQATIVVNATPGQASIEALTGAALGEANNIIVLDLANPLDFSTGAPRLSTGVDESLSETIQATLPEARVVKTLNTVTTSVMTNPGSLEEPTLLFVCGNDGAAKEVVVGLLRLMSALGTAEFNIRLVRK